MGINLDVTPYITPDDLVVMEIQQTISELEGFIDMGGGQQGSSGQKAPQTTEREASSTISVKDGDTILLGGFIRNSKTGTESGNAAKTTFRRARRAASQYTDAIKHWLRDCCRLGHGERRRRRRGPVSYLAKCRCYAA